MAEMLKVKYTGNSDPRSGAGAINGLPGRPDIQMGEMGDVTEQEYGTLVSAGLLLDIMSDKDVKAALTAPGMHDHGGGLVHDHSRDFSSMTAEDLQALADSHAMTVTGTGKDGTVTKKDLEDALTAAHSQQI